jgi:hypothetical protein
LTKRLVAKLTREEAVIAAARSTHDDEYSFVGGLAERGDAPPALQAISLCRQQA